MFRCSIPACIIYNVTKFFHAKQSLALLFFFFLFPIVVKIAFSKEFNLEAEFGLNAKVIKLRGILFSPFFFPAEEHANCHSRSPYAFDVFCLRRTCKTEVLITHLYVKHFATSIDFFVKKQ